MSEQAAGETLESEPLEILNRWIEEARGADAPAPMAMCLATVSGEGAPSSRMVSRQGEEIDGTNSLRRRLESDGAWRRSRLAP